jgi:hypothetical protein
MTRVIRIVSSMRFCKETQPRVPHEAIFQEPTFHPKDIKIIGEFLKISFAQRFLILLIILIILIILINWLFVPLVPIVLNVLIKRDFRDDRGY